MSEQIKTHWRQLINPDYIGAYSLPNGKDMTVRIIDVKKQMVTGLGGRKEECTVAALENNKPIILNSTNSRTIQNLYDTPYIEDWKGKEITLFAAKTKLKGEDVECIRIRPKIKIKPELIKGTEDFQKVVKAMKEGFTMDQVKTKFTVSQETEIAILEQ